MIDERSPEARPPVRARVVVTDRQAMSVPWQMRQRAIDAIRAGHEAGVKIVERECFADGSAEFLMYGDPVEMAPVIGALRVIVDYPA